MKLDIKHFNFVLAMGLGAFLIFFIQPLVSKAILPYLGGSSSIWAVSLSFFTLFLFFGYLYAFFLSKISIKKQIQIHGVLLFASLIIILINSYFNTPLYLPIDWFIQPNNPVWSIILFLTICVGLPYMFLAATAPLLQNWYFLLENKEPFKLYTISNLGSLLGLVILPLFLERHFTIVNNVWIWCILFLGYAYVLVSVMKKVEKLHGTTPSPEGGGPGWGPIFLWSFYSLLPSALLVATTTYVTQVIAPIPLLWIVPLTLYLLSFIIAFSGIRISPTIYFLSLIFIWEILNNHFFNLTGSINYIYIILGAFFFVSTALHQYIYILRPSKENSSIYYLAISFGGAVGTILVSLVAPLILKDFIEIYILLSISAIVLIGVLAYHFFDKNITKLEKILLIFIGLIFISMYLNALFTTHQEEALRKDRNFYGVTEIVDYEDKRQLNHGNTLHGEQFFAEEYRMTPTLYYSNDSGVGRSVLLQQYLNPKRGLKVGVVGLGTGTMGAYCREQDRFEFYEIDKRILPIAQNSFSYLDDCPNYVVKIGDGRIKLSEKFENEKQIEKYDVLAIDAFSDDSIPMHMVTKEAVEVFISKTKDTGILAIHTSNRYIDLEKVVKRIAYELDIPVVSIGGSDDDEDLGSVWILLSRDKKMLINKIVNGKIQDSEKAIREVQNTPLWTDEYTNIFPVMYQNLF